jgi:protoporphyrinogen/coproporphyrinogen III oxidase
LSSVVTDSTFKIAIIGGGVAGLSAAFTLRQLHPAAQVDLFESSARVGGAVQTETIDGFLVERGADMFATEPAAGMELCRELGIDGELIAPLPTARGAAIVQGGKLIRIPDGFVLMRPTLLWPMMRTPLLSVMGKLRLLFEPFVKKRGELVDESIESFVARRLGRETLDRIVQPLVGGIYTGDVAKLSMAATMPQFWEMERSDGSLYRATVRRTRQGADTTEQNSAGARYEKFRSFPTGMSRLMAELGRRIEPNRLHLSTSISKLSRENNHWHLKDATNEVYGPFDHVIVATPAKPASKLLADIAPVASRELDEIAFASSAVVVFGVHEDSIHQELSVAGFIVPIREQRNILAVSFTGDKFAGRTPPHHKLLRVFIGGELQADLLNHSDDELVQIAKQELRELIGLNTEPVLTKVVRWQEAMPQYHVGHVQKLATIQTEIDQLPGLSLIGNSLHGVGIAPTISYGRKVARAIIDSNLAH